MPVTPATHALHGAGHTVSDLADVLGVSSPAVSHYLAGNRRLPDRFAASLAELIGDEKAGRVLALIPPFVDRRLRAA